MSYNHKKNKKKRKRNKCKNRPRNKSNNTQSYNYYTFEDTNVEIDQQQQPVSEEEADKDENEENKDENEENEENKDTYHQTEIMLLQSDNLELKNEIAALKQQLIQRPEPWRPENDRCYIRNEVLEYHSMDKNDIETRSEIKEKQTKLDQAFDDHVNRLKEWSDFSDKLQNTFKNNEIHDKKIQLSKGVDLGKIESEMNMQKITGKSLEEMEKNDLKLFGFVVFDDMKQLYKRIRELVSKYPCIDDGLDIVDGGEGQILLTPQVQIPKQYICPISGKIMFDPVLYEEITYDRNNFLQHVEKYGTIPGSDQQYDKTEPLFKNIKLKQKIDAFLHVYPQFINEGL